MANAEQAPAMASPVSRCSSITPVDNNGPFSSPPTTDTLVNFVNKLGIQGSHEIAESPSAYKILWGIVNRAHIDYVKGCGKNSLKYHPHFTVRTKGSWHTYSGEKKATLIPDTSISSQSHLKFSAKGSKREVFGMTIPNELINNVIRGADYYDAYLEKVTKHQRYIAGEELSDPESPAPKPAKPTKQAKPKATEQPTVSKTKAKKSKHVPAKPKEKKRKPVSESSEAQPLAKRAKAGKVIKKRTVKSSKQLVDEFVDEGVPAAEPSLEDTEEAILQKVLKESLTDAYPTQRGPLPPVVIRETDTGKFQPLPEVPGKGKEKVGEEQAAQVLLNLQTQRLGLYGSDTESDEEMPSVGRSGTQDEGQAGSDPGTLAEGQAGSDPGTPDEGQAGPNPDDVAEFPIRFQSLCSRWTKLENTHLTVAEQDDTRGNCPALQDVVNEMVKELVISSVSRMNGAPLRARFKRSPTDSIRRDESEDFDVDKAQEETKKKSNKILQILYLGVHLHHHLLLHHRQAHQRLLALPEPLILPKLLLLYLSEYSAWTTTDTRIKPSITLIPDDLYMDDETIADEQAVSSDDEVGRDHIPTVNLRQSWWKPLTEDRPATQEPA
ncbi:hypothetical protein Tco_0862070 [Tanacetum coccineum]